MPINPLIPLKTRVPRFGDRISNFANEQNDLSRLARQDAGAAEEASFQRQRQINSDALTSSLNNARLDESRAKLASTTNEARVKLAVENNIRQSDLLASGNVPGAIKQQEAHLSRLVQSGATDVQDAQAFLGLLKNNPQEAEQIVGTNRKVLEAQEILKPAATAKPPTTKEFKVGNEIRTMQFNPDSGQFDIPIATAPRSSKATTISLTPSGGSSAKTTLYADGTSVQVRRDGSVAVTNPAGQEVSGQERLNTLKTGRKSGIIDAEGKSAARKQGIVRIERAAKASEQVEKIRTNVSNLSRGLDALQAGAATGPFMTRLPSFRQASVQLDNVQKSLGLDVVGNTTFGALSKGELDLALSKGLPTGLRPEALKEWILAKIDAQEKLANYLTDAALFMEAGGTPAEWLDAQRQLNDPDRPLSEDEQAELEKLRTGSQ